MSSKTTLKSNRTINTERKKKRKKKKKKKERFFSSRLVHSEYTGGLLMHKDCARG